MSEVIISEQYLIAHPSEIFVFGDNLLRKGKGGAAKLRDNPNTWGFVTKKAPNNLDSSFFTCEEYATVFLQELMRLQAAIRKSQDKVFLISKLGAGLANRYQIFENVIEPALKPALIGCRNVRFTW